jgi:hypothetical protein
MAWRTYITTKSTQTPDFFLYLPQIGLASQLELWLSIIGVCMPTLGPLIQMYVKPVLVKLNLTAESSHFPHQLSTVTRSSINTHQNYFAYDSSIHHRIVETPGHDLTVTTCVHDPPARDGGAELDYGSIYVRHDIESQVT